MSAFVGKVVRSSPTSKTFRVRVPLIHGESDSLPDDRLPPAKIASAAGITPDLPNGTQVLVSFGDNNVGEPYIFGVVMNESTPDCAVSAKVTDIEVTQSVNLPGNIKIKDHDNPTVSIDWNNLKCLQGQTQNIKSKFSEITGDISAMKKTLEEHKGVVDDVKQGVLNGVTKLSVKDGMFGTVLPTSAAEGQIFFLLDE